MQAKYLYIEKIYGLHFPPKHTKVADNQDLIYDSYCSNVFKWVRVLLHDMKSIISAFVESSGGHGIEVHSFLPWNKHLCCCKWTGQIHVPFLLVYQIATLIAQVPETLGNAAVRVLLQGQ